MSELYRSSDNSSDQASQSAVETGPATRADREPARDNEARQREDDAAIEARLDEADLPTRAEARAAALRPDTDDEDDYYYQDDFGPESDAAIEARLDEAGLPTRAEARAAALRPDADEEDDDEYDFSPESSAAIEARLDEAGLPTRAESRAAAIRPDATDEDDDYDDDQAAEYNGVLGALTVEDHPPDTGTSDRDQAAARDAPPGVENPGDPPARVPDSGTTASAGKPEPAPVDADDRIAKMDAWYREKFAERDVLYGERLAEKDAWYGEKLAEKDALYGQRLAEMDALYREKLAEVVARDGEKLAELDARRGKEIADLRAQLGKEITDLRAQLERPEQGIQEQPAAPALGKPLDVHKFPEEKAKDEQGLRWLSDARLGLGNAIAGVLLTHAATHTGPGTAQLLQYLGDAMTIGVPAIAVRREGRKEKNVHRSGS